MFELLCSVAVLVCFSFVVFVDYWTDEKEKSAKSNCQMFLGFCPKQANK